MTIEISFINLLVLLLLLLPFIHISLNYKLGLLKITIISILRMFIQLFLVGVYLQYIFKWNNVYINFLYLLIMIGTAGGSAIRTLKLKWSRVWATILLPMAIPVLFLIIFFNGFIVGVEPIWDAKYLIPVSGMILGNCLKGSIITLNNFFGVFKENEKEYLYSLGMGASKVEGLKPYGRSSLIAVLNPTIAELATLGIVTLPGMMTGQILGGTLPLTAIKYQIAIMILIFAVKIYNSSALLYLARRNFFDEFHMPRKDIFI